MTLEDLLVSLTPQSIALQGQALFNEGGDQRFRGSPPARSTIATHFRADGTANKFDREQMVLQMVREWAARVEETAAEIAQSYSSAAGRVGDLTLDELIAIINADMAHYEPGTADPYIDTMERLSFLLVAVADTSAVADEIRDLLRRNDEMHAELYGASSSRPIAG